MCATLWDLLYFLDDHLSFLRCVFNLRPALKPDGFPFPYYLEFGKPQHDGWGV